MRAAYVGGTATQPDAGDAQASEATGRRKAFLPAGVISSIHYLLDEAAEQIVAESTLAQAMESAAEEACPTSPARPGVWSPVVIALDSYAAPAVCAGFVIEARDNVKVCVHPCDVGFRARKGRPIEPVAVGLEPFVPDLLRLAQNLAKRHPFIRREVECRCAMSDRNSYAGPGKNLRWSRWVARGRVGEVLVLEVDLGRTPQKHTVAHDAVPVRPSWMIHRPCPQAKRPCGPRYSFVRSCSANRLPA